MGKIFQTLVITIFLSLFLFPFIVAQPPFQEPSQQSPMMAGYLILETGWPEYHKAGEDYYIHTHVYNGTDGLPITSGINCSYHLYDHQEKGGEHLDTGTLTQHGEGYYNYTNGSLLTNSGQYSVLIWCEGEVEGGFIKYSFNINKSGYGVSAGVYNMVFFLILLFFILAVLSFVVYYKTESLPIKATMVLGCFMFFLMGFNLISIVIPDSLINPTIVTFVENLTVVSFTMLWFVGAFIAIIWLVTFFISFQDMILSKKNKSDRYD